MRKTQGCELRRLGAFTLHRSKNLVAREKKHVHPWRLHYDKRTRIQKACCISNAVLPKQSAANKASKAQYPDSRVPEAEISRMNERAQSGGASQGEDNNSLLEGGCKNAHASGGPLMETKIGRVNQMKPYHLAVDSRTSPVVCNPVTATARIFDG
jgi:hypothetical protein